MITLSTPCNNKLMKIIKNLLHALKRRHVVPKCCCRAFVCLHSKIEICEKSLCFLK